MAVLNLKIERWDNPPNLIHLFFPSTLTDFEDRLSVPSLKTANKCCAFRNITKKLSLLGFFQYSIVGFSAWVKH